MKNIVGNIYGDVFGETFMFASKEFFEGDFVKIKENETEKSAELVGEVIERGISNKYFSSPEIVKYIDDDLNIQRYTIYIYTVISRGVVEEGRLVTKKIPAIPGKKVLKAEDKLIEIIYGLERGEHKVGYLKKMPTCTVKLNTDQLFNPHLFIVGKTGSGKSFFIKNFLSMVKEDVWVFSPSDEYDDTNFPKRKINTEYVLDFNIDNIRYYTDLNASEEMILQNISLETETVYSVQNIIDTIKEHYKRKNKSAQIVLSIVENEDSDIEIPKYANTLIGKLRKISNLKFSRKEKGKKLSFGNTIFNLEGYNQLEQECIIDSYLYKLLQHCKRTKAENRKKYIIVIEEAHNYVPSIKSTICKRIIIQLAREGRKYGISLCFITQRPRFFDQTALSQSGNKIIFSLPNQEDIKHITEEIYIYRQDFTSLIQNQRVGECIIAGDSYNESLEVKISF